MAGAPQQFKPITVGPLHNNTHNHNTHTHSTWTGDY